MALDRHRRRSQREHDLTLGLEVVLPGGRAWYGLRGLREDDTGYDLGQLFIGAEGTHGVTTAAVLKLFPPSAAARRRGWRCRTQDRPAPDFVTGVSSAAPPNEVRR